MEMYLLEDGKMIRLMDMENICIVTVHFMKGIGKMINSMVMVLKFGLMVKNMKENILWVKNMETDYSVLQTDLLMKDNFFKIICMEKVLIFGKI
jgi:hypothetical protein